MLNTSLSEFHTGYRAYRTNVFRDIPFQYNSDDFHFDTEIIIQLIAARKKIREIEVPTFYAEKSPGNQGSHQYGRSRNDSPAGLHARIRLFGAQLAERASQPSGTPNGGSGVPETEPSGSAWAGNRGAARAFNMVPVAAGSIWRVTGIEPGRAGMLTEFAGLSTPLVADACSAGKCRCASRRLASARSSPGGRSPVVRCRATTGASMRSWRR